jgi:hypothetical protein
MKPSEVPVHRRNATYVLPDYKLVYVSTPKAACTSIKWLLADLQGVKPSRFTSSLSGETSRGTTIHRHRWAWQPGTPRLFDLDEAQLAEIHPDNGWFTFTMTRHPGGRLWSAWQSKFLLREPRFAAQFKGQPWMPRIPESTDDVIEDWESFVRSLKTDKAKVCKDIHFAQQSLLLNAGVTPYDVIYDTSQFNQMLADVAAHLRKHGWNGTLEPIKSNETPLPAIERAFPEHVLETVSRIYADDFVKLDYEGPRPAKLRTEDYSKEVLAATGIIAERGERIGDLSRRARRLDAELEVFRQEKKAREESGNT